MLAQSFTGFIHQLNIDALLVGISQYLRSMQGSQLFRVGLHEIYVSFDLRHAVFPIVLVLDGNMAVKFLTLEFF